MAIITLSTMMIPLLEVISDRVVQTDGAERLEYWSAFQKLYQVFPHKGVEYGKIYNLCQMGSVLVILTRAQLREEGKEVPSMGDEEDSLPDAPLVSWTAEDWGALAAMLTSIKESMVREDANAAPTDAENSQVNQDRAEHDLFTDKVMKILRYIKIYKVVAPVRLLLLEQIKDEKVSEDAYPNLDKKLVEKLWKESVEEEDTSVRDQLVRRLFNEETWTEKLRKTKPSKMRTIGELRVNFAQKPLTLDNFGNRLDILTSDWCMHVFEEPLLNSFFFPDDVLDENSEGVVARLREARAALRREGVDPLNESIRLANSLVSSAPRRASSPPKVASTNSRRRSRVRSRASGGALYTRKATATRLEFEDSQEVDSKDPNGDGTQGLSSLPMRAVLQSDDDDEEYTPRKKARLSQKKQYEGKREWTAEEKTAIIEGIHEYGLGKWAVVKEHFDVLFALRTSTQIKDCFRTMLKRGEVPEDIAKEAAKLYK